MKKLKGWCDEVVRKDGKCGFVGNVMDNPWQTARYLAEVTNRLGKLKADERLTVCETGFNGGHSAAAFLGLDARIDYIGWDLGEVSAAHVMYARLKAELGSRIEVRWGDSKKIVPLYFEGLDGQGSRCDVIVVDG